MNSDKAKLFLSKVDEGQNISLYDHCVNLFSHIVRCEIPDVYEKFEDVSLEVKKMRQTTESYLTEVFELPEEIQTFVKEKEVFYKFKKSVPDVEVTIDKDEGDSDDDEDDVVEAVSSEVVEEPDLVEVLPDIYGTMGRFQEAGIGLSPIEVFELTVALKDLAIQFKLKKVKFWGKVFGIKSDYYIAEAPYQEGIVQGNFGWEDPRKSKKKSDEIAEEKVNDEEEDEDEDKVDEEPEEGEGEEEASKIPPVPEPQQKLKKRIPAEKNGTGVNEYFYFVCTKLGESWRVLPFMLPIHITEARYLKRYFTGDLDSEIGGCIQYPGKEAHFLRAQIARITATAWVAPNDFYKSAAEKDEDDEEDDEEEKDPNEIVLNPKFQPKTVKCLLSEGIAGWCHYRKAILDQGRCIPMKIGEKDDDEEEGKDDSEPEPDPEPEDEDDEDKKQVEDPEIREAIVEQQVPVLRSLSEDKGTRGLTPWSVKLTSKLVEERAVLVIYSNVWPEAYTYYDGKNFEHIYMGYGFKYTFSHYAPPIRVALQSEYVVGDDLIEHVDKEVLPEEEKEEDAEGEEQEEDGETEADEEED